MHEADIARQQEAIGILGVNLVYGVFYLHHRPRALLDSLVDNLTLDRLEINMVHLSGPGFAGVDNRLMSLHAIAKGFTRTALFGRDGEAVQAGELLFGRPLLGLRSPFRPITNPVLDMIQQAHKSGLFESGAKPVELCELSLRNPRTGRIVPGSDFLLRGDMLHAVGQAGLLSHTGPYCLWPAFSRRHTSERIVFLLGLPNRKEIFDPAYYARLPGGLLEGFGQLFMGDHCCPRQRAIGTATRNSILPAPALRGESTVARAAVRYFMRVPDAVQNKVQSAGACDFPSENGEGRSLFWTGMLAPTPFSRDPFRLASRPSAMDSLESSGAILRAVFRRA